MSYNIIGALGLLLVSQMAVSNTSVDIITNPKASDVSYSSVHVELVNTDSSLKPISVYTYEDPLVKGDYFFVNFTNGRAYCRALGHWDQSDGRYGDAGSIMCGDDENAYFNYNFYGQSWEYKDTGGGSRCYSLFKTIRCSGTFK